MEIMSQEISKLTDALAKAKAAFPTIVKNKTVKTPSYTFDYADLPSIEESIKIPLMQNGLVLMQPLTMLADQRGVMTILSHVSGQWVRGFTPLPPYNGKIQDAGKEITYLRRYSICSLIGITPEDDSDGSEVTPLDRKPGNSASPQPTKDNWDVAIPAKLDKKQIEMLKTMTNQLPELREEILRFTGKKLIQDIEYSKFQEVIKFAAIRLKEEGAA